MGIGYLQLISLRCLMCRIWQHFLNHVMFQELLLGHICANQSIRSLMKGLGLL